MDTNEPSKRQRTILEEINHYVPDKNKEEIIESRAHHAISSAINILELIRETYTPEEAEILEKRFLSSIKGRDSKRFSRCVSKIKESKDENN